jgi:2-polyprenyl-6-methoxyphenol hydroxylase-like FAD-dependent oxidoreductase
MALSNVEALDGFAVENLVTENNNQQVIGVEVSQVGDKINIRTIPASLVVDCSGRGSRTPKWLKALGYSTPPESVVTCGAGYATRLYRRDPDDPKSKEWVFITPEPPKEYRAGAAFPIEGNRWIVSLGGWHGHHAPNDAEGFLAFAKNLPVPDVYNIVSSSEPLSDIFTYKFPASLRRHYEKLRQFPKNYLVLGDAMCSFNPLYAQGMTTSALQAEVLDKLFRQAKGEISDIAKTFFRRVAKIIDVPWQTAVGEDFRFPETTGKKAIGTDFINWYISQIHRATHHDPIVGATFLKAMGMIEPPSTLFQPHIVWRVLQGNLRNRKKYLTQYG